MASLFPDALQVKVHDDLPVPDSVTAETDYSDRQLEAFRNGEHQDYLAALPENYRMRALGVDLSRYEQVEQRTDYKAMVIRKNRSIVKPIAKTFLSKALFQLPDPVMLTHIVTTRCNYSCGFCCFADTLNVKTNELSLDEIEQTYETLGENLNVIVYSGGETTLNKDLCDIIEAAYRLTPVQSVYIISNAWKPDKLFEITHRIMQRCPELHLTWSLSIEGTHQHNNATRYTRQDTWDAWQNTIDTLYGMKRLREHFGYQQLDVQLCTVCTPDNHELLDTWYPMVRDVLQPDKWNINLMRKSVQMSDNDFASFEERRAQNTLEDFETTYIRITQQVRDDVLSGKLKFLYHTAHPSDGAMKSAVDLLSQEENRRTVMQQEPTFHCGAGQNGAFIGSEGQVSGCEEFALNPNDSKAYGNLRDVEYDFQALWRSNKAKAYRALVGKSSECKGCTLESQRNYPSILVSFNRLMAARALAKELSTASAD